MKINQTFQLLAFLVVNILAASSACAQDAATGAISGIVYDPANHAVSKAEVLAENEATHVSRSVTTNSEGVFRVPLLPPGSYVVAVKMAGFAENTSHSIEVTVSQTTSLNVTLALAAAASSAGVGACCAFDASDTRAVSGSAASLFLIFMGLFL